jgi:hypothetical protein
MWLEATQLGPSAKISECLKVGANPVIHGTVA